MSLSAPVCVHKGGVCRQTGSRGLQNRTGDHNSSSRSTGHRQTGWAEWWLLTDRNLQPTTNKEHISVGETLPYSHIQTNIQYTHTQTFPSRPKYSNYAYSWRITLIHINQISLTLWLQAEIRTQFNLHYSFALAN